MPSVKPPSLPSLRVCSPSASADHREDEAGDRKREHLVPLMISGCGEMGDTVALAGLLGLQLRDPHLPVAALHDDAAEPNTDSAGIENLRSWATRRVVDALLGPGHVADRLARQDDGTPVSLLVELEVAGFGQRHDRPSGLARVGEQHPRPAAASAWRSRIESTFPGSPVEDSGPDVRLALRGEEPGTSRTRKAWFASGTSRVRT